MYIDIYYWCNNAKHNGSHWDLVVTIAPAPLPAPPKPCEPGVTKAAVWCERETVPRYRMG
jgi:hypothetical protein